MKSNRAATYLLWYRCFSSEVIAFLSFLVIFPFMDTLGWRLSLGWHSPFPENLLNCQGLFSLNEWIHKYSYIITLVSKKLNSYLQKIQWCFTFQIYFDMNTWIHLSSHAVKTNAITIRKGNWNLLTQQLLYVAKNSQLFANWCYSDVFKARSIHHWQCLAWDLSF